MLCTAQYSPHHTRRKISCIEQRDQNNRRCRLPLKQACSRRCTSSPSRWSFLLILAMAASATCSTTDGSTANGTAVTNVDVAGIDGLERTGDDIGISTGERSSEIESGDDVSDESTDDNGDETSDALESMDSEVEDIEHIEQDHRILSDPKASDSDTEIDTSKRRKKRDKKDKNFNNLLRKQKDGTQTNHNKEGFKSFSPSFVKRKSDPNNKENGKAKATAATTTTTAKATETKTTREIFHQALQRALGGGIPGAIAGMIQVLSLMWLRTVINYQYRYGSTFLQALTTLHSTGGIPRLYSGVTFALIQAPLSRFVSTAANDGVSVLLKNLPSTRHWGPGREVVVAAFVVGFFRFLLMPIDTMKTVLQIESGKGFSMLMENVRKGHVNLLYSGALANALSSFIGHYPWFYTYNVLSRNESLVQYIPWRNVRNALIGFLSSIVSDTVANFMRVIKTTKQALGSTRGSGTGEDGSGGGKGVSYAETISVILAVDGWKGLFGRGLKTRIFANALQSIVFTVIWRGLAERWSQKQEVSISGDDDDVSESGDTDQSEYDSTMDKTDNDVLDVSQ